MSIVSTPSAGFQCSLESRLQARLAKYGSPEYVLTWKHWDMKSGGPICALRASRPRTRDKGCFGWPTPIVNDGEKRGRVAQKGVLAGACQLYGWATPTVRGHKDGGSVGTVDPNSLLGRQVWAYKAATGKCGVLNPAFSLWLMGYSLPGWLSSGARAMQSYRSWRQSLCKRRKKVAISDIL